MSKKHYQALARAIHAAYERVAEPADPSPEQVVGFLADAVADVLAADSPRFDRALFLEACETGGCEGVPKRQAPSGLRCPARTCLPEDPCVHPGGRQ